MIDAFALDGRFRNAKLVNPVTDRFKSLLNSLVLAILGILLAYPQRQGNKAAFIKRRTLFVGRIFILDQFLNGVGSPLFVQLPGIPCPSRFWKYV